MGDEKLLVTVVVDGNIVKNTILDMERVLTDDEILSLSFNLNNTLNGLSMQEINLGVITKLKEAAGGNSDVVERILEAVADAISVEGEMPIYTSSAMNIFKYPELTSDDTASKLVGMLEEKNQLAQLISEAGEGEDKQGIQVYIGTENSVQAMKDCSVVTATYEWKDGLQGTIGIVGPKRMDYDKVVSVLKNAMAQLDEMSRDNK